ncbi:MAG TPA: HAMP domain-containing sensor histidine kinase, partial [Chroococcales cyanobacterium]
DGAVDDPETARRMLVRAKSEVERLQHLVVNLLSVEKVAQSRRDVSCAEVLLEPRVAYAVETVAKMAAEKNIQFDINVKRDVRIYANPEQLDQVLLNLIENAVKFTPEGGKVSVKAGLAGFEPGRFEVSDTGIGMAAREIPRIFERFYRIDRARSRGSTGLGLSIVKHIADLHGAKINVTSKEGVGSTFQLTFPGPK